MTAIAIRQHLVADADHKIHLQLPREMGNDVEIIVWERQSVTPAQSLEMASLIDQSGFVGSVLSSEEEDCWNDL